MKRRKLMIAVYIGVVVAVIIIAIFVLPNGKGNKIGYSKQPKTETENKVYETLVPNSNTGEVALKNACGIFSEQLKNMLIQEKYEAMYEMLNKEVLKKYGYTCNKDTYLSYWKALGKPFGKDIEVMIFRTSGSGVSGGVLANYCVANSLSDSIERDCYDYESSRWVELTLYFDQNGNIVSMIPCPEVAIDSYANILGFEKEQF